MAYTQAEIVKNAKKMKADGVVYGYGYKYETVTTSNIASKGKLYAYTAEQRALMKKKVGKKAIDCSGFVNRAAGTNLGGSSQIKESSPQCWSVKDASHVMDGMFIWRSGHIGLVYIENGKKYIIEARSTASDLTISTWETRARSFTHYGKIKGVKYVDEKSKTYKDYSAAKMKKDMIKALGLKSTATKTQVFNATVTISRKTNKYHGLVDCVEKRLKGLGYYTGKVESEEGRSPIFGDALAKAVKQYEKKVVYPKDTSKANGTIGKKSDTWKKLLNL